MPSNPISVVPKTKTKTRGYPIKHAASPPKFKPSQISPKFTCHSVDVTLSIPIPKLQIEREKAGRAILSIRKTSATSPQFLKSTPKTTRKRGPNPKFTKPHQQKGSSKPRKIPGERCVHTDTTKGVENSCKATRHQLRALRDSPSRAFQLRCWLRLQVGGRIGQGGRNPVVIAVRKLGCKLRSARHAQSSAAGACVGDGEAKWCALETIIWALFMLWRCGGRRRCVCMTGVADWQTIQRQTCCGRSPFGPSRASRCPSGPFRPEPSPPGVGPVLEDSLARNRRPSGIGSGRNGRGDDAEFEFGMCLARLGKAPGSIVIIRSRPIKWWRWTLLL